MFLTIIIRIFICPLCMILFANGGDEFSQMILQHFDPVFFWCFLHKRIWDGFLGSAFLHLYEQFFNVPASLRLPPIMLLVGPPCFEKTLGGHLMLAFVCVFIGVYNV